MKTRAEIVIRPCSGGRSGYYWNIEDGNGRFLLPFTRHETIGLVRAEIRKFRAAMAEAKVRKE